MDLSKKFLKRVGMGKYVEKRAGNHAHAQGLLIPTKENSPN